MWVEIIGTHTGLPLEMKKNRTVVHLSTYLDYFFETFSLSMAFL